MRRQIKKSVFYKNIFLQTKHKYSNGKKENKIHVQDPPNLRQFCPFSLMIDLISFEIVSRSTSPRLTLFNMTLFSPLLCWQFLQLKWDWEFDCWKPDEFELDGKNDELELDDGKTDEFEFDGKLPLFPDLLSFCWKRFPLLLLLLCSLLLMTSFLK